MADDKNLTSLPLKSAARSENFLGPIHRFLIGPQFRAQSIRCEGPFCGCRGAQTRKAIQRPSLARRNWVLIDPRINTRVRPDSLSGTGSRCDRRRRACNGMEARWIQR
jgi:hypothetical protein